MLSVGILILSFFGAAAIDLALAGTSAGGESQLMRQNKQLDSSSSSESRSGINLDASVLLVPHHANAACGSSNRGENSCINPKSEGLVCDRRHCLYYDQLVLPKEKGFRIAVRKDGRIHILAETCAGLVNASTCDAVNDTDQSKDGTCARRESVALPEGLERVQHTWDIVATCGGGQTAAAGLQPGLGGDSLLAAAVALPPPSSTHAVFFTDFSNFINYYHFTVDCLLPLVTLLFDLGLVELGVEPSSAAATSATSSGGAVGGASSGRRRHVSFRRQYQLIGAAQKSWRGRLDLQTNVFERPGTFYNVALSYVAHPDLGPRALFFQKEEETTTKDDVFPSSPAAGTPQPPGGIVPQPILGFEFALLLASSSSPSSQESSNLVVDSDSPPLFSREHFSELASFESASFGMPYVWEDLVGSTGNREAPAAPSLARDCIRNFAAFLHAQTNAVRLPASSRPRVGIIHRHARR